MNAHPCPVPPPCSFRSTVAGGPLALVLALGLAGCPGSRSATPAAVATAGGNDQTFAPGGLAALAPYGPQANVTASGNARDARLAVDPSGVPTLAWLDAADGTPRLRLRTFAGSGWLGTAGSDVGQGLSGLAGAERLALGFDPRGAGPCVAWAAPGGGGVIAMRCLIGGGWRDVAGQAPAPATAAGLNDVGTAPVQGLGLAIAGQVTLFWSGQLQAATDGLSAWQFWSRVLGADGTLAPSTALASATVGLADLAVGAAGGATFVAATVTPIDPTTDASPATIKVFQQQGSATLQLGRSGPADPSRSAASPALAVSGTGLPTVAWIEAAPAGAAATTVIAAATYDGQAWTTLPTPRCRVDGCGGMAAALQLAIDASGRPVLAWQDGASGRAVVALQRLVGGAWVDVGASGSAPDVLGRRGDLTPVGLAVDPTTQAPVLAWRQGGDIFVAKVN